MGQLPFNDYINNYNSRMHLMYKSDGLTQKVSTYYLVNSSQKKNKKQTTKQDGCFFF